MKQKAQRANLIFLTIGITLLIISGILFMRVIYLRGVHESKAAEQSHENPDIPPQSQNPSQAEAVSKEEATTMQISEAELTAMINEVIPKSLPLKNMTVTIDESGTCTFSVDANVKELATHANTDLGLIGAALKFMPDYVPLSGAFAVFTDGKGNINFILKSMQFEGIDVPASMVPKDIFPKISEAVSKKIQDKGRTIENLRFQKGMLYIDSK